MPSTNRVLIVDDHPLTREGLALAARNAVPGATLHSVGSVAEGAQLLAGWPAWRMIVLDFVLPDAHGYVGFLTLQSLAPSTPIVIISAREDVGLVEAATALGAAGYLFKSRPLDEIAAGLRQIEGGVRLFPANIASDRSIAAVRQRVADLSPAQLTVLLALADGRSNKRLAFDLSVTEATIKAHLTAIFRKLGVTNRSQALIAVQPLFQAEPTGGGVVSPRAGRRPSDLHAPSFRGFPAIAIALPIVLLAALWWIRFESVEYEKVRNEVADFHERRIVQTSLLSRLTDTETAQRGYRVTRDPSFLEPYGPARRDIVAMLDSMRTGRDPDTPIAYRNRVDGLATAKLAELDRTIAVVKARRLQEAKAIGVAGRGHGLMTVLHKTIGRQQTRNAGCWLDGVRRSPPRVAASKCR